ncbi:metalloendopeptidase [Hypoxylon texense]
MAPSLLKTVGAAAAVLATQVTATTSSYKVTEIYNTTNFFDKFNFVTDADPNGGYVQYQSRTNAENLGIIKYKDGAAYVGVDYTKTDYDPNGVGRKSVRLESKNVYNHGLIIADFTHLPKPTCGSWPAFWFFGEPWPTKGEIDVYENWNDLTFNRHTAHVDAPSVVGDCKIVSDGMTSTIDSPNCYDFASGQAEYQGCSASKYSSTFGSSTGGVYAMEWTSDYLKIWEWSHLGTPLDVTLGQPSPNNILWGTPSFVIKKCDVEKAFKDMKMVLNIDFCAVAGQTDKWASCKTSTGYDTCAKYVAKKASDFSSVNFKVKDIKVYQLKDTQTSTTSSTISSTTTTSSATLSTSSSASVTSSSSVSTSSSTSSYIITDSSSSSAVSSTITSSASYSTASSTVSDDDDDYCTDDSEDSSSSYVVSTSSTVSDDDDDYCTDDGESTSSSYVVSPTGSVSATTTGSSSGAYITSAPVTSYPATSSYPGNSNSYAVSDSASEYPGGELTTSTIYATTVYTVTSCAPTVTNCPAGGSYVTTEVISIGVTVCPVTETGGSSPKPTTTTAAVPEGYTTSTVEVTKTYTITSCAATVTNCPVGAVTTEVSVTTTVCPIENGGGSSSTGKQPAQGTTVVVGTPGQSTGVATTPNYVATPEASSSSSSTTTTTIVVGGGEGSGSSSETDVYVTATVVPVTSAVYTGYTSNAVYPNATLATSVTTPAGVASSSAAIVTPSASSVVEVSGAVKTGASLALAGVAALFMMAM